MTTKQIDYCIELAHTLNFSRAAENLFVSQPTFSYQIRLLEEEIGFPLFERSGKGASLTPAGAQFIGFLTGMREDLKRAVEQGQNFSARYRDSISVVMINGARFLESSASISFVASICAAWGLGLCVLLVAPRIIKVLGRRGSLALERVIGILLILISVQMFMNGIDEYNQRSVPATEQNP